MHVRPASRDTPHEIEGPARWRHPSRPATLKGVARARPSGPPASLAVTTASLLMRPPMRQRTVLFVSLVAGTVFFNACSDPTQPTSSSADKVGFEPIQQFEDPVALLRGIPGFGGFFFDRDGAPTVYLRDVSARAQVERSLGPWLLSQGVGPAALRVRQADYDWPSLERWQGRATGTALAMRGVIWVDADEA